jgi:signal transduction histidine kinase
MPEKNLRANPILPLDKSGVLAAMVARIGLNERHCTEVVERRPAGEKAILAELERERSRIGRELHAGAGQPLAGIIQNLEMLSEYRTEMPPQANAILARIDRLATEAMSQVRAVSHALYPPDWQRFTIEEALRILLETSVPKSRYEVTFQSDRFPFEPSNFLKIALYRCAQECIANMVRHAEATRLNLGLRLSGTDMELEVCDNGCGFSNAAGSGIGIRSIHDYARMLGGCCYISSNAGGTRITIRVPLVGD